MRVKSMVRRIPFPHDSHDVPPKKLTLERPNEARNVALVVGAAVIAGGIAYLLLRKTTTTAATAPIPAPAPLPVTGGAPLPGGNSVSQPSPPILQSPPPPASAPVQTQLPPISPPVQTAPPPSQTLPSGPQGGFHLKTWKPADTSPTGSYTIFKPGYRYAVSMPTNYANSFAQAEQNFKTNGFGINADYNGTIPSFWPLDDQTDPSRWRFDLDFSQATAPFQWGFGSGVKAYIYA
jgi:hypothetical protein